jgi:hypothetical protein
LPQTIVNAADVVERFAFATAIANVLPDRQRSLVVV